MVIKASDRLADVLARDDRVLDTILETVPDLRGLRNPVTRRVMGRLATVAEVARMAGIEPDILLRRVNAALARTEEPVETTKDAVGVPAAPADSPDSDKEKEVSDSTIALPPFLESLSSERVSDLDVREDLRNGREPFSRIMAAKAGLAPGAVLRLRATFEPVPLYAVLGKQGFDHWTEQLAADDWRVWFYPQDLAAEAPAPSTQAGIAAARRVEADGAAGPDATPDADVVIIDVRGLDPPEPMVRTLAALETLAAGQTLLQINERVPQFLIPRLEELGFTYDIREQAEGVVRVFIRRPETN